MHSANLLTLPNRTKAILFFLVTGVIGAIDMILHPTFHKLSLVIGLYFIVYVIGHQLLLHRYFTHKQFKVSGLLHKVFCFWSVLPCLGSPLTYSFDHRLHHKFSDTEKDIHGPKIGLFRAFFSYRTEELLKANSGRFKDKDIFFVHNNYYKILFTFLGITLLISPVLFIYVCFSIAFNIFVSDIFNYLNHWKYLGSYRNYDLKDNSSNHILWGYFAFCWHNNHHKYPFKANEQAKWWELDLLYHGVIRWIKH